MAYIIIKRFIDISNNRQQTSKNDASMRLFLMYYAGFIDEKLFKPISITRPYKKKLFGYENKTIYQPVVQPY